MKGSEYTVLGEVIKEAKTRLERMSAKQAERLQQMADEYHSDKYEELIKTLPKNT